MTPHTPLYTKHLPEGRLLVVECLLGLVGALSVGTPALIDELWLYDDLASALAVAQVWDGTDEPPGWCRHPQSGRRRPDGTAASEYVQP